MPGKKPAPHPGEEFQNLPLYVVLRKHLDPSLEGDGSDTEYLALFQNEAEAEAFVRQSELSDPDSWNAYSVQGPLPLSSILNRLSLSQETLRRIQTALGGSRGGPILL